MTGSDPGEFRTQHDSIRREFGKQAASWGKDRISPDLHWVASRMDLEPQFEVLDVAAGTGLLSRAIAPNVKRVVAVDITPEMLAEGRREAEREGIANIQFELGAAEDLPWAAQSFDMVVTRFSMHHFTSPEVAIREMHRVCRSGGSVAVIDLVSPEQEALATRYNEVERLRDPTHTRALSPSGLSALVGAVAEVTGRLSREVEMRVDDWLEFSRTEPARRREILDLLECELAGGEATGMRPFLEDGTLRFMHTWGIVIGTKR